MRMLWFGKNSKINAMGSIVTAISGMIFGATPEEMAEGAHGILQKIRNEETFQTIPDRFAALEKRVAELEAKKETHD